MIDFKDLVFRFTFPGVPIVLIYIYISGFSFDNSESNLLLITAIFLLFSSLIGYVIQQLWFSIFESIFGYNRKKRPVLMYIKKHHDELPKGYRQELNNNRVNINYYYSIWENILYHKINDSRVLRKLNNVWDFLHSNCAIALGLIIGLLYFIVVRILPNCLISSGINRYDKLILFLFLIIIPILIYKAKQTWKLINDLELNLLKIWLEEIKSDIKNEIKSVYE